MILSKTRNQMRTALSRFRNREDGVAAIEFAFIAPLLVVFLVGTTTATQSLWAHGKIAQTSSVVGDLISQENEIDNTSFGAIMKAGPVLIEPFPVSDLTVSVIAAIACHQDPNDTENSIPKIYVAWSNGWTGGNVTNSGPQPGTLLANAPTDLSIKDGDYIIKTEVTYTYKPPISQTAGHTVPMNEIAYHQPRDQMPVSYPTREGNADTRNCNKLMNR